MIEVTVNTLDEEIKEEIRTVLMRKLLRRNGSLPLSNEDDKVIAIAEDKDANDHLKEVITKYYRSMSEKDVDVRLSPQEYARVYFRYV